MELSAKLSLVTLALVGCHHGRGPVGAAASGATLDNEVELYRDGVVVRQVIPIDAKAAGASRVKLELPSVIDVDKLIVAPHIGAVAIGEIHAVPPPETGAYAPLGPTIVEVAVNVPQAGHYAIEVAYATTAITWDAAYTMTTDEHRKHAQLRGAVAIRNSTGIDLPAAQVSVVDGALEAARMHREGVLVSTLAGGTAPVPIAAPKALGIAAIPRGETRIEMLAGEPPRTMNSVLVYDAFGTKLDHPDARPLADYELGAVAPTKVTESFEIDRPKGSTELPAGPIRLLARRADGSLVVLGESQFDASSRDAPVDSIAVGLAEGVTAKRTRIEMTDFDEQQRLVEEFEIDLDNKRAEPIDVVVREHAYRGQAWSLGFYTINPDQAGKRAFTLHAKVAAKSHTKVAYTIVYTWLRQTEAPRTPPPPKKTISGPDGF